MCVCVDIAVGTFFDKYYYCGDTLSSWGHFECQTGKRLKVKPGVRIKGLGCLLAIH